MQSYRQRQRGNDSHDMCTVVLQNKSNNRDNIFLSLTTLRRKKNRQIEEGFENS